MSEEPDHERVRELVAELESTVDELERYGAEHEIPAIERTAQRIAGTVDVLKQNVPGMLTRE